MTLCLSLFALHLDGSLLCLWYFPRGNQTPVPLPPKVQREYIQLIKWFEGGEGWVSPWKLSPKKFLLSNLLLSYSTPKWILYLFLYSLEADDGLMLVELTPFLCLLECPNWVVWLLFFFFLEHRDYLRSIEMYLPFGALADMASGKKNPYFKFLILKSCDIILFLFGGTIILQGFNVICKKGSVAKCVWEMVQAVLFFL